MNDFGLFEEFLDDFLSVPFLLKSSMIWQLWRKCLVAWWEAKAAGRRVEADAKKAVVVVPQWQWWTKCMSKCWSKLLKVSKWTLEKTMSKKKTNKSSPRTNRCWSSSVKWMWIRRKQARRGGWFADLILRSFRKMRCLCILGRSIWRSLRSGRQTGGNLKLKRRKNRNEWIVYTFN